MIHFVWIVKDGYLKECIQLFEDIIQKNLYYDKMIFYFENSNDQKEFITFPLYQINQNKIDLFDINQKKYLNNKMFIHSTVKYGFIMNEIAHIYSGICTYIFVEHINKNNSSIFISKIIESIQKCIENGIYIKGSSSNTHFYNKLLDENESISENSVSKTYYAQYEDYLKAKDYYDIFIISFNYEHVWIKKLFFELKYISLTPHIITSYIDFYYLLNFLYYKYIQMYAKSLA
jgi:hypothetical protein